MSDTLKFPVIAIGCSAGCLKPLIELVKNTKSECNAAYVILQHYSPECTSHLSKILQKVTPLPVVNAVDIMTIKPNTIYIIPPNAIAEYSSCKIKLSKIINKEDKTHLIDLFFSSLAENIGEYCCAVLLSGYGKDGIESLKKIRLHSGCTFVQTPETADVPDLPQAAVESNYVNIIADPLELAEKIYQHLDKMDLIPDETSKIRFSDDFFNSVIAHLRLKTGHDFSGYKKTTLYRRLERRINISKAQTPVAYKKLLESDSQEYKRLFDDFLIGVTKFFRDINLFYHIKTNVVEQSVQNARAENHPVRIWIHACSTGEEAYSIALLFQDYLQTKEIKHPIQIYASDINEQAIEIARKGVFSTETLENLDPYYIEKYFYKVDNRYKISREIRETIVFAQHNLFHNPPYSQMDIVSCRNLMIYLTADLQRELLHIFAYSLKTQGYLILGTSESASFFPEFFSPVENRLKIYKKCGNPNHSRIHHNFLNRNYVGHFSKKNTPSQASTSTYKEILSNFLLSHHTPLSILTNERGEILYIHGKSTPFFELKSGKPSNNIIDHAAEFLKIPLANAFRHAVKSNQEVQRSRLHSIDDTMLNLKVCPIKQDPPENEKLILFTISESHVRPQREQSCTASSCSNDDKDLRIIELERELHETRQYLESTITELENANEELSSSNEETQAINEELQSANEELETSREELQASNEELTTLNDDNERKIIELNRLNNDIHNFLLNSKIAMLFLDSRFNIIRFTPAINTIFPISENDTGKPIQHFLQHDTSDLISHSKRALHDMRIHECEIETETNIFFWRRILPYKTTEGHIEGVVVTYTDITERKKIDKKLKENEEKLRTTISSINDLLFVIDKNGYFIEYYSPEVEELFFPPKYFLHKHFKDLGFPKEMLQHIKEAFTLLSKQDTVYEFDYALSFKDGIKWFNARLTRKICKKNKFNGIVVVSRNITERKNALEALKHSEQKFRELLENLNLIAVILDREANITFCNNYLCEVSKYNQEEIINHNWFSRFNVDKNLINTFTDAIKKGSVFPHHENSISTKDGKERIISWNNTIIKNGKGMIIGVASIGEDITEKKFSALKLQESEERFRTIFNTSPIGAAISRNTIQLCANESYASMFGYKSPADVTDTTFFDQLAPEVHNTIKQRNKKREQNKNAPSSYETLGLRQDGTTFPVFVNVTKLDLTDGPATLAFIEDISERKKFEKDLIDAKKQAEDANIAKSQFLSNMSHEIRTPMNSIIGIANLIKNSSLNKKQHEHVNVLLHSAENMMVIINDILDFNRFDLNAVKLTEEIISIDSMLSNIQNLILPHTQSKKLKFTVKRYKSVPDFIQTDHVRLEQIILNLLGNAVKYTEKGSIQLKLSCTMSGKKANISFSVIDTGPGISPDMQEQIFDRFYQGDMSYTKKHHGTGLGLAISQKIAEAFGGKISLLSEVGTGSTFIFKAPFTIADKKEFEPDTIKTSISHQKNSGFKGMTVLVAEDNQDNLYLIQQIFKDIAPEITLIIATNGKEALEKFSSEQPDFVLMDIQMPYLNGVDATKTIRKEFGVKGKKVPIIALTAYAMDNEIDDFKSAGMNEYLSKPVSSEKLLDLLIKYSPN